MQAKVCITLIGLAPGHMALSTVPMHPRPCASCHYLHDLGGTDYRYRIGVGAPVDVLFDLTLSRDGTGACRVLHDDAQHVHVGIILSGSQIKVIRVRRVDGRMIETSHVRVPLCQHSHEHRVVAHGRIKEANEGGRIKGGGHFFAVV